MEIGIRGKTEAKRRVLPRTTKEYENKKTKGIWLGEMEVSSEQEV